MRSEPRLQKAARAVIFRGFPVPGAGSPHQDIRQRQSTRPHNPSERNSDANKCTGQEIGTADTSLTGRVPVEAGPTGDPPQNLDSTGLTPQRFRLHSWSRFGEQPGVVAQLVRAPDCRSGGCGFESRPPRFRASFANPANEAFFLGFTLFASLARPCVDSSAIADAAKRERRSSGPVRLAWRSRLSSNPFQTPFGLGIGMRGGAVSHISSISAGVNS